MVFSPLYLPKNGEHLDSRQSRLTGDLVTWSQSLPPCQSIRHHFNCSVSQPLPPIPPPRGFPFPPLTSVSIKWPLSYFRYVPPCLLKSFIPKDFCKPGGSLKSASCAAFMKSCPLNGPFVSMCMHVLSQNHGGGRDLNGYLVPPLI